MLLQQWRLLSRQATCLLKCWPKRRCSPAGTSVFAPLREAPEQGKVHGATSAPRKSFSSEVDLPKLRPPPLKNSVELYLEYTRPLVPPEQWQRTVEVAKKFLLPDGEGEQLQRRLQTRAEEQENWVLLDRCELPVDKNLEGAPLCMAQNYALFGNCRKPGFPQDSLRYQYGMAARSPPSRYICVLIRNNFHLVQVLDDVTNEPLPTYLIFHQLRSALLASVNTAAAPVGLFTTLPRDDWFAVYSELSSEPSNMDALTAVQRSLFVLCLDTGSGVSQLSTLDSVNMPISFYDSVIANNSLHGVNSKAYNAGNRWFDKTQFIISRDGVVGLNFEHSPFDGHVGVAVLEAALAETPTAEAVLRQEAEAAPSTHSRFHCPRLIEWVISPAVYRKLEVARDLFDTLALDTDVVCAKFTAFSRSWIKSVRLSPDAFVQIGLQLAYARLHPTRPPPATYESGSLRRFRLGRTETIRSCSAQSVAFIKAMKNSTVSDSRKCAILRQAIERHQLYTKVAVSGNGFDRHLLGLRLIAADAGLPTPDFFSDPTYETANHFLLSTSQISGQQDFGVSFGPVAPDGYGFCYNLQGDHMNIMASTFKSTAPDNSARDLLSSFATSLLDMRKLLECSDEIDFRQK
nr:unnamed protein product [Spirometra erinaceieuropaei]